MPPAPGVETLQRAVTSNVETVLLPQCGHEPKVGSADAGAEALPGDPFSRDYTRALSSWFEARIEP